MMKKKSGHSVKIRREETFHINQRSSQEDPALIPHLLIITRQ